MSHSLKSLFRRTLAFVLIIMILVLPLLACKKPESPTDKAPDSASSTSPGNVTVAPDKTSAPDVTNESPTDESQAQEDGLPVLTIDGVKYPVTAADGIKGLPNAHDGVIVRSSGSVYDPVYDAYVTKYDNNLYKNDGTCLTDFQGDVKFRLDWLNTIDQASRIKELDITTSFMPVKVPANLDEEAFGKLMEENGFLNFDSRECYSKVYTENGAIDMLSEDFTTTMIESFRRDFNLPKDKFDDAYVMNAINNNLRDLRYSQIKKMLIQDLKDGTSTLYCELRVTYRHDTTPNCQVILYAKEDTISSWLSKWNPSGLPVEQY